MGLLQSFDDGLRPIKRIMPSEWAQKYRVLDSMASSEYGRWRNERTPYLTEIMDCFSPYSPLREVVIMKGAQVGLTEAGFNVIGFFIDTAPCGIMYVMPTEAVVRRNSKTRFEPMVRNSPTLSDKMDTRKVKDKSNSILEKSFPGGVIVFAGANSPGPLRSLPMKVAVIDELDAMPIDVGGEGNPVDLVRARTNTFPQKKIMIISTPTNKGASMIEGEYENTDKRRYFVPCPECGLFQTLEFQGLVWEDESDVRYKCCGCDHLIEEKYKQRMLELGEWRPTNPIKTNERKAGYHLSGLYSPYGWFSWSDVVNQYNDAQKDTTKMKVFVNTVLGESYEEGGEMPDWEELYNRRENYPTYRPPKEVMMLTAGVDVQKDRLEIEIVGWHMDMQCWSVDYRVIPGDVTLKGPGSVWEELRKITEEVFEREDGRHLTIRKVAIDSGYATSEVYDFVRSCDPVQVIAVKGMEKLSTSVAPPRPIDYMANGKTIKFNQLWGCGVSFLKSEIYRRLKLKRNEDSSCPPGYCHFPTAYESFYFRMLTAEKLVADMRNGYPVYTWVKHFKRNEAIDCRVYARAALATLGAERWTPEDWKIIEGSYASRNIEQPKRERRSSFWDK